MVFKLIMLSSCTHFIEANHSEVTSEQHERLHEVTWPLSHFLSSKTREQYSLLNYFTVHRSQKENFITTQRGLLRTFNRGIHQTYLKFLQITVMRWDVAVALWDAVLSISAWPRALVRTVFKVIYYEFHFWRTSSFQTWWYFIHFLFGQVCLLHACTPTFMDRTMNTTWLSITLNQTYLQKSELNMVVQFTMSFFTRNSETIIHCLGNTHSLASSACSMSCASTWQTNQLSKLQQVCSSKQSLLHASKPMPVWGSTHSW